ncbi:MAG: PilW family protein [Halanaerobiaceae bacterium]
MTIYNYLQKEDGVTLLELLAVIAISSIVLAAIFSLYIFAFDGYNQAQDIVLEQQDLLLIKNYFDSELKNAEEVELMSTIPVDFEEEFNYIYFDDNSMFLRNQSGEKEIAKNSIASLEFTINKNSNEDSHYNYSLVYNINDKHQNTMILNNLNEYDSTNTTSKSIIRYKQP